jgi:hypothetical protein
MAETKASGFRIADPASYSRFHPFRAIDGNPATAWQENAEGAGLDEWIEVSFHFTFLADAVVIMPGWFDPDEYANHNRLKRIVLYIDNRTITADLPDGMKERRISLGGACEFTRLRVVIKDVYRGGDGSATCISEIGFELKGEIQPMDSEFAESRAILEERFAGAGPPDSPAGLVFAWADSMGLSARYLFFEDHVFVYGWQVAGYRVVGGWKVEGGRIILDDLRECVIVGLGRYLNNYNENYEYRVTRLDPSSGGLKELEKNLWDWSAFARQFMTDGYRGWKIERIKPADAELKSLAYTSAIGAEIERLKAGYADALKKKSPR